MSSLSKEGYWQTLRELGEMGETGEGTALRRRDALKLLSASIALATAPGCGRHTPQDILPYVNSPQDQLPGVPRYYATTVPVAGFGHGVLAETVDGRPIKLEGNPDHPNSMGASGTVSMCPIYL